MPYVENTWNTPSPIGGPIMPKGEMVENMSKAATYSPIERVKLTKPVLGIEGGMGKEATIEFERLLIAAAAVLGYVGDDGLPTTKTDNELKPDRSPALLGEPRAESPVEAIIKGLTDLFNSGVELAVMPCNTAHGFINEIREGSPVPIISLIEVLAQFLSQQNIENFGLLATDGSAKSGKVFDPVMREKGINIVFPKPDVQKSVMAAIYDENGVKQGITKAGKHPEGLPDPLLHPTNRFKAAVDSLVKSVRKAKDGKRYFIAGCTEVPLALEQSDMPEGTRLIDPMKLMALALVKIVHDRDFQEYIQGMREQKRTLEKIEAELEAIDNQQQKTTENRQKAARLSEEKDQIEVGLKAAKIRTLELTRDVLERNPITLEQLEALEAKVAINAPLPPVAINVSPSPDSDSDSLSGEATYSSEDELSYQETKEIREEKEGQFREDLEHCRIDPEATRRSKGITKDVIKIEYILQDPNEILPAIDAINRMVKLLQPIMKRLDAKVYPHRGDSRQDSGSSSSEGSPPPEESPIAARLNRRWDVVIEKAALAKLTGENAWVRRVIEERLQAQKPQQQAMQ